MRIMRYFSTVLLLSCISLQIHARPYATGLTNESGAISFRLNESADSVKVISAGGTVTNDLGPLAAGFHTVPLSVTGAYEVQVFKVSEPGFISPIGANRAAVLQISTDTNLLRFNNPRGLAVNTDPASPYFGRVYVANMSVTNSPPFARPVGDGIYVLNSDLSDALGQGDTALTGGLDFTQSASASPFRLNIGTDGNLYISDWSDATGSVYVTDPDVSAASGQNVLGGPAGGPFPVTVDRIHGSIGALWVEGSLVDGNLTVYTVDEDLQMDPGSSSPTQRQSLWRHDIGSALPGQFVMPTRVAPHANSFLMTVGNQVMDLDRATNGNFVVSNYRSTGGEANVWLVDPTSGGIVWSSLVESRALAGSATAPDFLRAAGGIALSPMGDYLAVINIETNGIAIVPMLDGRPDITNRMYFQGMGVTTAQGREVAFDAAGNLYAVSSGAGLLRVFSPGGTSTAITGSDGTFRVLLPASVSAFVEDSQGYEEGADALSFKVVRSGSTAEDLTVNLSWSGTASNGVDYVSAPVTVVIPAGQSEAIVPITPIDDNEAELTETVSLTLGNSPNYNLGAPIVASGTISDDETVVLRITPADTNAYERFPSDTLAFTITRLGNTNTSQFVLFNFGGSATLDTDYAPLVLETFLIPEGVVSTNYLLQPVDDSVFEGDEFVTVTLIPNDYQVDGTAASASGRIREDEYPPETPVFADNFNDAATSNDWTLMFWSSNNIPDYTVDWAFDYSVLGIPPAPGSAGDTHGVRITVNKTESTPTGAAAVNLYPTNQTFSGDYALRFDMYLQYGTVATTEHALLGINHSGLITNRISQSATTSIREADGIWIAIENDGSANREWTAYTSTNANSVPRVITNRTAAAVSGLVTSPPYAVAGSPGNLASSITKSWADVELSQTSGVVTLSVNKNVIYRFTNTFGFNSGTIMIGYNDQFDSVGSPDSFVIFDNVRVVQLGSTITDITGITVSGNNVLLDFDASGQASDFRIDSTPTLSPPAWAEETGATVAPAGSGFRATVPVNGAMRFYRIRR